MVEEDWFYKMEGWIGGEVLDGRGVFADTVVGGVDADVERERRA